MTGVIAWLANLHLLAVYLDGIAAPSANDRYTVITFHKTEKSWNDAQMICATTGGNLFREDSKEKAYVLKKFKEDWLQEPELLWIGLHSVHAERSLKWTYGMNSCYEVKDSLHSAWFTNESTSINRCGAYDSQTRLWYKAKCKIKHEFVCERLTANMCSFNVSNGRPLSSLPDNYQTENYYTVDHLHCQNKCLSSMKNSMDCWAINYNETSTECMLYFTEDPFLFQNYPKIETVPLPFFLKVCYESKTNSTVSVDLSDTTSPDEGCKPNMIQSPNIQTLISTLSSSVNILDLVLANTLPALGGSENSLLASKYTAVQSQTTTQKGTSREGLLSHETYRSGFSTLAVSTTSVARMAKKYSSTPKTKHNSSVMATTSRHMQSFSVYKQNKQSTSLEARHSETTLNFVSSFVSILETTQNNLMTKELQGVQPYSVFDSPVYLGIVSSVSGIFVVGTAALASYVLACRGRSSSGSSTAVGPDEPQS